MSAFLLENETAFNKLGDTI